MEIHWIIANQKHRKITIFFDECKKKKKKLKSHCLKREVKLNLSEKRETLISSSVHT